MSEIDLKKIKKAYFIGIGGIGQSAVARMLLQEGTEVFGSDISASEITAELERLGADIQIVDNGRALPDGVDLVIYTVAVSENHPERVEAKSKKIPEISYPEALSLISKNKFTIAIAGTHGKTTTTAMVAHILIEAGLEPTVIVGSLMRDPGQNQAVSTASHASSSSTKVSSGASSGSNFIAGKGKYFVVEACEYKRSFLNLHPNIVVITNVDEDHLDYYKNLAGVQEGFSDFVKLIKPGGTLVTDTGSEKVKPVLFGRFSAEKVYDHKISIQDYNSVTDKIVLKIPGQHNIQNAKAALLVALAVGITKEKALQSLADFAGTWRRFENKGETQGGVQVFDDYAHHPSEIQATLLGARELFPKEKIVVAFQPHLYSRTKEHLHEFSAAFKSANGALADEVLILPIYAAREPADPAISSEILVEKMKSDGLNVKFVRDFDAAADYVRENLKKGDIFFTMGAGDVNTVAKKVLG